MIEVPTDINYLSGKEAVYNNDTKKLAIFDMDETLIHTLYKRNKNNYGCDESNLNYDAQIPIINPDKSVRYLYINIRPYVREVLIELK